MKNKCAHSSRKIFTKFRLYPTDAQREELEHLAYLYRFFWNLAIDIHHTLRRLGSLKESEIARSFLNRIAYEPLNKKEDPTRKGNSLIVWLRTIRNTYPELSALPSTSLDIIVGDIAANYKTCAAARKKGEKAGDPGYKSRRNGVFLKVNGPDLFTERPESRFSLFRIPLTTKPIKVRQHKKLGLVANRAIYTIKEECGEFYLYICNSCDDLAPSIDEENIGIDVGIEHTLALSNGEFIEAPEYNKAELRRLNKRLSRRQKGSNRRQDAKEQLAKFHLREQRRFQKFYEKVAADLHTRYRHVFMEDNVLTFLQQNDSRYIRAKSHRQSISLFYAALVNKFGDRFVKVDARYTSQLCSQCGETVKKELNERQHVCPFCGCTLHRDTNAALNIKARGEQMLRSV